MDSYQLLYWHWLLLGLILLAADVLVARLNLLWLGIAALIVSGVTMIAPSLSPGYQLLVWALGSAVLTIFWSRYLRGRVKKTEQETAQHAAIGEAGTVERPPAGGRRGMVRFPSPILGVEEWEFTCEQEVEPGDRVFIKDVSDHTLEVVKL